MEKIQQKVYAYILHATPIPAIATQPETPPAHRLLVFTHPGQPGAGVQVPGGTVEPGELPAAAVMREAVEETGLVGLRLVRFLGEQDFDPRPFGKQEWHQRHFYQLAYDGEAPDHWHFVEHSTTHPGRVHRYDYRWVPFPAEVPELIAEMGAMLARILL